MFLIISVGVQTLVHIKSLFFVTTISCHLLCVHLWLRRSPHIRPSAQSAKVAAGDEKCNDNTVVPRRFKSSSEPFGKLCCVTG